MLNHSLEWDKFVLSELMHPRQWLITYSTVVDGL